MKLINIIPIDDGNITSSNISVDDVDGLDNLYVKIGPEYIDHYSIGVPYDNIIKNNKIYNENKAYSNVKSNSNHLKLADRPNASFANFSNRYIYGEIVLILLVLFLWLISILLCLSKYTKLRSLQPLANYRGLPMNIDEVQIVENESDTIIYKKKKSVIAKKHSAVSVNSGRGRVNSFVDVVENIRKKSLCNMQLVNQFNAKYSIPNNRSKSDPDFYKLTTKRGFSSCFMLPYDRKCSTTLLSKYSKRNSANVVDQNYLKQTFLNYEQFKKFKSETKVGSSVSDRRNIFASSKKRHFTCQNDKECKRNVYNMPRKYELVQTMSNTSSCKFSIDLSQDTSAGADPNLLNPNWVPLDSYKYIKTPSNTNISDSESILRENKKLFDQQDSLDNNSTLT